MRIEEYFQAIQDIVNSCPIIHLSEITYDKRGTYEGFISGKLLFSDNSILHFREFVDIELKTDRLMYAYQYLDLSNKLVFRYDNTGHHKKLAVSTYPHHKHQGNDQNIMPSNPPDLISILQEIEMLIQFS